MASSLRKETSDIIKNFFQNPSSFSFIQAVRLLSLHEKDNFSNLNEFLAQGLSIVPELSLGHPSTDIVSITPLKSKEDLSQKKPLENKLDNHKKLTEQEKFEIAQTNLLKDVPQNLLEPDAIVENPLKTQLNASEVNNINLTLEELSVEENPYDIDHIADKLKYKIEVTFLALYGSSSPLPTFYTEDLLDEAKEDSSACRDFLDIFNQLLYVIYYKSFNRYKLALRTIEFQDRQLLNLQFALMGFANPYLREKANINFTDLRFIKSFIRYNRSAEDLEVFLSWRLNIADVEVEQCISRQMPIPKNQYCILGTQGAILGDAVIGKEVTDLNNKIRIHLRNLNNHDMQRFAYSGTDYPQIENCLRIYLDTVPDFDVILYAKEGALPCIKLGDSSRAMLGVTSFLSESSLPLATEYRISTYS